MALLAGSSRCSLTTNQLLMKQLFSTSSMVRTFLITQFSDLHEIFFLIDWR